MPYRAGGTPALVEWVYRNGRRRALPAFDRNDQAFKYLDPFFVAFLDFPVDAHHIAGLKINFPAASFFLVEINNFLMHTIIIPEVCLN